MLPILKRTLLILTLNLGAMLPAAMAQRDTDTATATYDEYEDEDYVTDAGQEDEDRPPIRFSQISAPLPFKERDIAAAQWKQLSSGDAFVYTDEAEQIKKKSNADGSFLKMLDALFNFFISGAGKAIIWIVVALLVLLIVFRIFKLNGNVLFARRDKKLGQQQDESADDYVPQNWEQTIAEAARSGNYRLAVRHSYRYLISLLHDNELIRFETAKTNYQYAYELSGTRWHQPFVRLTRQYEYAWYGGFDIDQQQFEAYYRLLTETRNGLS